VGLNWDVTQRKRAEAALRDMEAAERASHAKSEFLARMSHELRTPLNAILGFAQLLEHDGADGLDGVQRERLARMRSAGMHLLSLIEDVLDLAAVEAGSLPVTLQPTALDDTVDEVRQWLATMADEQRVGLQVQPSGATLLVDPRRLRQIVANLVTNAIKYNRPGGQVWVSACRTGLDGAAGWELSVRDNGRGLSEAQQAHLFEPFNRLGAEREGIEGRGIGLSTVRQLVQLMGGRVQVHSRPAQGSDFRVWLPAAPGADQADPADGGAAMARPADAAPMRLLYIEDNPVNALVVRELVALCPQVELRCAVNGRQGMALALDERPDLVLVDLQLPDIDGYEVLRQLRAADPQATVVALSANALPDEMARARAAGFDDYWTKPIDFEQFLGGLDRLATARAPRADHPPRSTTAKG
jgi:CheY-like chemotaxis protein/nitrogen-specific signal transduction histidine kinase